MNNGYIAKYDEAYYLRGKETGVSLYSNYTWKPELTLPMAARMILHLGLRYDDVILDYGCARGYTVKALRQLGHNAFGYDISEWAINNCDDEIRQFLVRDLQHFTGNHFDWIIAKDVLEHIPYVTDAVGSMITSARCGIFAIVPLSKIDGNPYVVPDYEKDVTHIHRLTLGTWASMFMRPSWTVEAAYRIPGIKDNYSGHEYGNGFVTARRVK